MKSLKIYSIVLAALSISISCSKSNQTQAKNQVQFTLTSPQGIQLASSKQELEGRIIDHLKNFDATLKVTVKDLSITDIQYFSVADGNGVCALVSYSYGNVSTNVVIGSGAAKDMPAFGGTLNIKSENDGTASTMKATCVSYTANCSGESCCSAIGTMGADGKMTFTCSCTGCTLNVTTKTYSC